MIVEEGEWYVRCGKVSGLFPCEVSRFLAEAGESFFWGQVSRFFAGTGEWFLSQAGKSFLVEAGESFPG